jgi:hypothetical protein
MRSRLLHQLALAFGIPMHRHHVGGVVRNRLNAPAIPDAGRRPVSQESSLATSFID